MYLFIWKHVDDLTGECHPGGGAVVAAETCGAARLLLPPVCSAQKSDPDEVLTVDPSSVKTRVFIFPDAGCC